MKLPEGEARKKWCPMVRAIHADDKGDAKGHQTAYNRVFMPSNPAIASGLCIASDCMMWTWTEWSDDSARAPIGGQCGLKRWM